MSTTMLFWTVRTKREMYLRGIPKTRGEAVEDIKERKKIVFEKEKREPTSLVFVIYYCDFCMLTTADGLLAELKAALEEHSYGFRRYTILTNSKAQIDLLEDSQTVVVMLDATTGYTNVDAGCAFESLTALLSSCSPQFNHALHSRLVAKLEQLQ